MKSFLSQKVWLAFGFAMLALLLMGLFSYRWMVVLDESDSQVRHTTRSRRTSRIWPWPWKSIGIRNPRICVDWQGVRSGRLSGQRNEGYAGSGNHSRPDQWITRRSRFISPPLKSWPPENPARGYGHQSAPDQGFAAAVAAIDSGPANRMPSFIAGWQIAERRSAACWRCATRQPNTT